MGDTITAEALEADLLARYGVDLLDLYRGRLSLRRVCALVAHLPDDAAVWTVAHPDAGWTRTDALLATLERRVTALWATVAAALGQQLTLEQLASPLALTAEAGNPARPSTPGPEVKPLREIALMMRGS